MLDGV